MCRLVVHKCYSSCWCHFMQSSVPLNGLAHMTRDGPGMQFSIYIIDERY